MKRRTLISLFIAIIFIVVGSGIFTLTLAKNNWGIDMKVYETKTYELTTDFDNINIETETTDINLLYSTDNTNKVECYERENVYHSVEVIDNTLNIKVNDTRKWYEKISAYSVEKITVYLAKENVNSLLINATTGDINISNQLSFNSAKIDVTTSDVEFNANVNNQLDILLTTGDVEIDDIEVSTLNVKTTTGDIDIENVNCKENLYIKVTTGKVDLKNITCNNLTSEGSSSDINLKNVISSGKINIQRSTGDVKIDKCDANEIEIKSSTGDITGTLLSDMIFTVETTTGKKHIPESVTGGKCKLTTTTGDIIIEISKD